MTGLVFNPIALRGAKIVYNFGLSECNRVEDLLSNSGPEDIKQLSMKIQTSAEKLYMYAFLQRF